MRFYGEILVFATHYYFHGCDFYIVSEGTDMNFKRILVVLVTLVMLLCACAPAMSVFAMHDEAHFELQDNTIEKIKDNATVIMNLIVENYDEAYDYVENYLNENGDELYDEALEISKETYIRLLPTLIRIKQFAKENGREIENKLVEEYFALVDKLYEFYGKVEPAIEKATEIYFEICEMVVEFNEKVENLIATAIDTYNQVLDVVCVIFGDLETATDFATDILTCIVEYVENSTDLTQNAQKLYSDIRAIALGVYGETGSIEETLNALYAYVYPLALNLKNQISDVILGASYGDYTITNDSYYLALGNAEYALDLANMLYLGEKYSQFDLNGDYISALEGADLVTIKFNNGEFDEFARQQVLGKVMEFVDSNRVLKYYYNLIYPIKSYVEGTLGVNLQTRPQALDWSKYLDDEGQHALADTLARVREELLAQGLPEYTDIAPMLNENVISVYLPTVKLKAIDVPTMDFIMFGIENLLYSYAEAADRVVTTLETVYSVAPEATVVITGISLPTLQFPEEYSYIFESIVDVLNANLYAFALERENTIFVNSDDADDIYSALNAHCGHHFDDCEDGICNICGEEFETLGHVLGEYTYNGDATCHADGTQSALCINCGKVFTTVCTGTALEHEFGDWFDLSETLKRRECKLCGVYEDEIIAPITPAPLRLIGPIIVACLAIFVAVSTAIVLYIRGKRKSEI